MVYARRVIVCASLALAETTILSAASTAQSVAEYYKGKTIAILMGTQNPKPAVVKTYPVLSGLDRG
jgi:hypothetical protein